MFSQPRHLHVVEADERRRRRAPAGRPIPQGAQRADRQHVVAAEVGLGRRSLGQEPLHLLPAGVERVAGGEAGARPRSPGWSRELRRGIPPGDPGSRSRPPGPPRNAERAGSPADERARPPCGRSATLSMPTRVHLRRAGAPAEGMHHGKPGVPERLGEARRQRRRGDDRRHRPSTAAASGPSSRGSVSSDRLTSSGRRPSVLQPPREQVEDLRGRSGCGSCWTTRPMSLRPPGREAARRERSGCSRARPRPPRPCGAFRRDGRAVREGARDRRARHARAQGHFSQGDRHPSLYRCTKKRWRRLAHLEPPCNRFHHWAGDVIDSDAHGGCACSLVVSRPCSATRSRGLPLRPRKGVNENSRVRYPH